MPPAVVRLYLGIVHKNPGSVSHVQNLCSTNHNITLEALFLIWETDGEIILSIPRSVRSMTKRKLHAPSFTPSARHRSPQRIL